MPDIQKSVSTRRKKLRKLWTSKQWRDKVKEFIGNRSCQWCHSNESLTAHHPFKSMYGTTLYTDLYLSQCLVLCRRCHFALHHGKELCPECKKNYKPFEFESCFTCYTKKYPEILEKVKFDKEQKQKEQREYRHKKYIESKQKYKKKTVMTND